jgi:hypothetical protein
MAVQLHSALAVGVQLQFSPLPGKPTALLAYVLAGHAGRERRHASRQRANQ